MMAKLNILYSATRQWNPGDEFILQGTINILQAVLGPHNAVIYNRNPEVRLPPLRKLRQRAGLPCLDNSLKPHTDCSFADLAVFAGLPEWCNALCTDFYVLIHRFGLPALFMGLGSHGSNLTALMRAVLSKALYISFRSPALGFDDSQLNTCPVVYRACPALLCVPCGVERHLTSVRRIGLVFAVDRAHAVLNNCVSPQTFAYLQNLYAMLIHRFAGQYAFTIICHYIDELPVAHHLFAGGGAEIAYHYDANAYADIYCQCDLVISARVHGCGIAAALGIPSIIIAHDFRSDSAAAFLSRPVTLATPAIQVCEMMESMTAQIAACNRRLIGHKQEVFEAYLTDLTGLRQRLGRVAYAVPGC